MNSWKKALLGYLKPAVWVFFFLGFSCGIPYNLLNYSLNLWLNDVATPKEVIGLFSLVVLPYSLKFLWSPMIDNVRLPFLSKKMGVKRAWGLIFQIGLLLSVWGMAFSDPAHDSWRFHFMKDGIAYAIPLGVYVFAFLSAFFAASQDIVVDALRIDTLTKQELGEGSGMYQYGYRIGMLLSGAGVVALAGLWSWQSAYLFASLFVIVGMLALCLMHVKETPRINQGGWRALLKPFSCFMKEHQAWIAILLFVVLYKICNAVLGRMVLTFYRETGFSNNEISLWSGLIGPWITVFGAMLGGILVAKFAILKLLLWLGCVEILTSLAFAGLAVIGYSLPALCLVITFDNIVGGMGGAVFVAYLSGLCDRRYSATQYAILSSVMAISTSTISAYSGFWAKDMGWPLFFVFTGVLMIPALCLLKWLMHKQR